MASSSFQGNQKRSQPVKIKLVRATQFKPPQKKGQVFSTGTGLSQVFSLTVMSDKIRLQNHLICFRSVSRNP